MEYVDYDVSYGVRCIVPVYGSNNVVNLFKRNDKVETIYTLEDRRTNFLNIVIKHAVVNMSNKPRIALMFTLNDHKRYRKTIINITEVYHAREQEVKEMIPTG